MRLFQIGLLVFLVSIFGIFPSASQSDVTATPLAEVTDIPVGIYTSSPTTTSTATITPTRTSTVVTITPEYTPDVESTSEPMLSVTPPETILTLEPIEVTVEITPEIEITPESTVEIIPTVTLPEVTVEVTDAVLSDSPTPDTETITPTSTSVVEVTAEVTEVIGASATPEPLISITPTATLGVPMVFVQGAAFYQNHQPDHSGIEIRVLDANLSLLSVTYTGTDGVFAIAVPADSFYWLVADAPLHRAITLAVQPGFDLPDIHLSGGDLNNDGCVDSSDVQLITVALNEPDQNLNADVNGDGLVDVVDIAILTGNFELSCHAVGEAESTLTPQPEATSEATSETLPPTLVVTIAPTPTVTDVGEAMFDTPTLIPSDLPAQSPIPSVESVTEAAPVTITNTPMATEDAATDANEN